MLVVCPLKIEFNKLLDGFASLGWQASIHKCNKGISFARFADKNLTVSIGGHGKSQFALQTHYLVGEHGPFSAVLCVGTAGGLSPELKAGDVVIGESTVEHDYTERFDPKAELPRFPGDPGLLARLGERDQFEKSKFAIYRGLIASGDEDITDHNRAEELAAKTGAMAVAWEGAGGARACRFLGLKYLELRGISDNARDGVADSFVKNLPMCMSNLAFTISRLQN